MLKKWLKFFKMITDNSEIHDPDCQLDTSKHYLSLISVMKLKAVSYMCVCVCGRKFIV